MSVYFLLALRDSFSSMIGKEFPSSASYLGVSLEGASPLSSSAFLSLAYLLLSMLPHWISGKCCTIAFGILFLFDSRSALGTWLSLTLIKVTILFGFWSARVMILFLSISKLSKEVNWLIPSKFFSLFWPKFKFFKGGWGWLETKIKKKEAGYFPAYSLLLIPIHSKRLFTIFIQLLSKLIQKTSFPLLE